MAALGTDTPYSTQPRCPSCGHPLDQRTIVVAAAHGMAYHDYLPWSPCDSGCQHGGQARDLDHPFWSLGEGVTTGALIREARAQGFNRRIEAWGRFPVEASMVWTSGPDGEPGERCALVCHECALSRGYGPARPHLPVPAPGAGETTTEGGRE